METSHAVMGVVGIVAVGLFGVWRVVVTGPAETYSPSWHSASTGHAQRRKVFVASPVVTPSRLSVNDSVAVEVTDARVKS